MPNAGKRDADAPVNRTDIVLLAVVAVVIVGALLLRQSDGTERAKTGVLRQAPQATESSPAAPFFVPPGAKDEVKRDLRQLVSLQEMFFVDSAHYANDVSLLGEGRPWRPASRIRIVWADRRGWAATATGNWLGAATCVIRLGIVPDSVRPRTHLQQREGPEALPLCDGDP